MARRSLADLRDALQRRCDLLVAAYASQAFKDYPSLRIAARLSSWRHRRQVIDSLMKTMEAELKGHIELPARQTGFARLRDLLLRPRFAIWLLLVIAALVAVYKSIAGDILNYIALRDDPPALALRGIAMARLGDLSRAKILLRRAAHAFGPHRREDLLPDVRAMHTCAPQTRRHGSTV